MKEGIDAGHEKRANRIGKLEDTANLKAAVLDVSKRITFGLASKYRLNDEDARALDAGLEKALIDSIVTRQSAIRELAVETLRQTMKERGINAPGLRDDFIEELEERMKVRHR